MKRLIARRPTPATAIACVALFVSLGGVSYGVATGSIDTREIKNDTIRTEDIRAGAVRPVDIRNDSIRTEDVRNNEVRGLDIRNSTIRGMDIAVNTVLGVDIAEATLDTVPSATRAGTADTLDGLDSSAFARPGDLGRFSVKLAANQTELVATHGQVSVSAQCIREGGNDTVRLLAATTSTEAVMDGTDDHTGPGVASRGFLTSTTDDDDRVLLGRDPRPIGGPVSVTNQEDDDGFVMGPDGKGLHIAGEATALGFDYADADCIVAGEISKTG